MQLINDWKRKFPRLWSVRLALLAAVMSSLEVGMNVYINGQPPMFATLAVVISMGSAISRVIAQPSLAD
jgi:hypothetical protein